jgi:hypothetical protein
VSSPPLPPKSTKGTPAWVVLAIFVVVPLVLAFVISRQAGAQQIRRKAIAKSYNWAVENKNEGQVGWILRGFHRDRPFEAVALLREGGGDAWRARIAVRQPFGSWALVASKDGAWQAKDFGTISTLVTRTALPPAASLDAPEGFDVYAQPGDAVFALDALKRVLPRAPEGLRPLAVSFVDDGVVLDGRGPLPEGQALIPALDYLVDLVDCFEPRDAGAP